jgi:hypothetical protein
MGYRAKTLILYYTAESEGKVLKSLCVCNSGQALCSLLQLNGHPLVTKVPNDAFVK